MSNWNSEKKAAFVKSMGKGRARFAKGGKVKRKKFASGGGTQGLVTAMGGLGVQNAVNTIGKGFGGLGLNNNFKANAAGINPGTNNKQLNAAYTGTQGALDNQGNLVQTLAPQAEGAVQNQNFLADQYAAMARGEGPNPARAELEQATGQNVANQAALMAGQRGASANAGLMARQAAQQGAGIQQTAAGQEAVMEAQQQIAAQNNLANLANNQISQTGQAITGQNTAQQNEQAILQNANTSANNANVGMQSNINNVGAQVAAGNQGMAGNIVGGIGSAVSSIGGLFAEGGEVKDHHVKLAEMNAHSLGVHTKNYADGGETSLNSPDLGKFKASSAVADQDNFSGAAKSAAKPSGGGGGMESIIPMIASVAALADGGQIHENPLLQSMPIKGAANLGNAAFSPGSASNGPNIESTNIAHGKQEDFAKDVKDYMGKNKSTGTAPEAQSAEDSTAAFMQDPAGNDWSGQGPWGGGVDAPMAAHGGQIHEGHVHEYFAGGGEVPALVSAGEVYLSPEKVRQVIEEGANPMKIGEKFKGKAKKKDDSYENDTIPKTLEEGGVVIPRHITKHKMSAEKAELFVHRAIARKKAKRS